MEIEVSYDANRKLTEQYIANIKDLPGSPYVGKASIPELAVAQAFLFNIKSEDYSFDFETLDWEIQIIRKGY